MESKSKTKMKAIPRVTTDNDVPQVTFSGYMACETKDESMAVPKDVKDVYYTRSDSTEKVSIGASAGSLRKEKNCRFICCNSVCQMAWGIFLIVISILGFIYPIMDIMLWEKLNMRPGLPAFEWWLDPPESVKVNVYIFNVTNHDNFLKGIDAKINVEEIGPIVYAEKIIHSNVKFNDNDTLSYTSKRNLRFLPDENKYNLNETIYTPNVALLGIASMLHNSFFFRTGFRLMLNVQEKKYFAKKTIYEFLWEYEDDILERSQQIVPGLVPVTNMGILFRMSETIADLTVKKGPRWGHRDFFKIQEFKDVPELSGYDLNRCLDNVKNASDGVMYHQHLSKDDTLLFFRKQMCAVLPLQFDEETTADGMQVYKYNFSNTVFNWNGGNASNCRVDKTIPDGMKDASKCYFNFPMVLSFPHFHLASVPEGGYVTGLTPEPSKHSLGSVYVEPLTGTPARAIARLQCNLQIHNIKGLYSSDFDKFSGLIIPTVWMEYVQDHLPPLIRATLYFTVVILPILSPVLFVITCITGLVLVYKVVCKNHLKNVTKSIFELKRRKVDKFVKHKVFLYEHEAFIKNGM